MFFRQQEGRRSARQGAVLMETVLVIPLFMILLGGLSWIGDLMITRQKLLVADRYVAWNNGLRYPDKGPFGANDLHRLFFSDRNRVPSQYHAPRVRSAAIEDDYEWSHASAGQATVRATMPAWVYSMINAAAIIYRQGNLLQNFLDLNGREQPGQRHVVLMRTRPKWLEGEPHNRNRYGVEGSGRVAETWEQIADEAWPYEND